jgi:tetratricopeptide (TPR) repeat protein
MPTMLRRRRLVAACCCVFLAMDARGMLQKEGAARQAEAHERLKAGAGHLQQGETDQAVQDLKKALALDPKSAAGHLLLGQAYLALRSVSMIAEAKAELQQALDIDPTLLWAHFYLAKVYIDQGRYDRAKEQLQLGLDSRPDVPHFLSLLGEVHRKLGDPQLAIELNQRALKVDPALTPAYYYIGLAYMDLKQDEEAIRALERSIASPYVAPEMYLTLGSLYARKKRYEEGEELCRKAVALDPSRPEAHVNLAQLYNIRGASDQALEELRVAVEGKSFPSSPYYQQLQADVFFETGRAYQAKRMPVEAIRAFLTALELNPDEGRTHRQLAEAYLQSGDYARALQHALKAEKLGSPVDSLVHAEITERMGGTRPALP